MLDLITGLGGQLIGVLVVIGGLVLAFLGVKRSGAKQAQAERRVSDLEADIAADKAREASDAEIRARGADPAARDELRRRWGGH